MKVQIKEEREKITFPTTAVVTAMFIIMIITTIARFSIQLILIEMTIKLSLFMFTLAKFSQVCVLLALKI